MHDAQQNKETPKQKIARLFQAAAPFVVVGGDSVSTKAFGGDLSSAFVYLFQIALSAGAILAMFRIAWAGYKYMTTDAFGQKNDAKEILRDAIFGLLLLYGIYLILNQINPQILQLDAFNTDAQSANTSQ